MAPLNASLLFVDVFIDISSLFSSMSRWHRALVLSMFYSFMSKKTNSMSLNSGTVSISLTKFAAKERPPAPMIAILNDMALTSDIAADFKFYSALSWQMYGI